MLDSLRVKFLFLFLISLSAFAQPKAKPRFEPKSLPGCPEYQDDRDPFEVHQMSDGNRCVLNIVKGSNRYVVSSDGQFSSIFWPESVHNGTSRQYFFLPRSRLPSVQFMTTGDLELTAASGHKIRVSAKTGQVIEISNAELDGKDNAKIVKSGFLMVDSGTRVGIDPNARKYNKKTGKFDYRSSVLRDETGKSCTVKNTEIFVYDTKNRNSEDARIIDDSSLYAYLSKHPQCSKLNLASINRSPRKDRVAGIVRTLPVTLGHKTQ